MEIDYNAALEAFAQMPKDDLFPAEAVADVDPEPPVQEPAPAESEPAAPVEPQDDDLGQPSAEDDRFGRLESKLDVMGSLAAQQQQWLEDQQRQQLYAQQQRQQEEWQRQQQMQQANPKIVLDSDIAPLAQNVQQIQHMMRPLLQTMHVQEVNSLRSAEAALKAKYADFDDIIPPAERAKAFNTFANQMQYGQDWSARLEHAYKVFAFDKVKTRADELAAKREQKRAEEKAAAQKVAPSGAVFQQPVAKLDSTKRGYEDAAAAFKSAMQGL